MSSSCCTVNNEHEETTKEIKKLLRPEDKIILTVRLEGGHNERQRYLSIICNQKADELNEYCLLGIDSSIETKPQTPTDLVDEETCNDKKVTILLAMFE